jgi:hypothetical protein
MYNNEAIKISQKKRLKKTIKIKILKKIHCLRLKK